MSGTRSKVLPAMLGVAALLVTLPGLPGSASAAPARIPGNFADEAFKNVWMRTDALVDNGTVKRSYYWGPIPGFTTNEDYAQGPGGKHLVQYFDKSRMEINNPNGDKNNPFYVTNGLLTVELISGQMQVGDNQFVTRYPAEIDIASDTDDVANTTPTYASFRSVVNDFGDVTKTGQTVLTTINRNGQTGTDARYNNYGVTYNYYEPATKHNIPDVFWQFLNATGPVMVGGKVVNARLNDPYFYATGYPIADAYWASVKIAGLANTDVLIQPYQRRVLTYVPTAPAGFKVQMGNIGQHYYGWRYQDQGKPPVPPVKCGQVPVRGFGKVWADNPDVQQKLGCTYSDERSVTVAQESFQHGQMIDVIETYGSGQYSYTYKTIYVLFEDGTLQRFPDSYVDGTPEPTVVPPAAPGLFVPVRGFGKVWREGTGARVRERLGWATAPEVGTNQGAMQYFNKGLMVFAGPQLKKIYVLYSQSGYGSYDTDHWQVFDDTYQGP